MLRPFLSQELLRLQRLSLDLITPALKAQQHDPLEFSSFFWNLSCRPENYFGLPTDQQQYIARICEFRRFNAMNTIISALYRTGGLYRDVPTDVNTTIQHLEITTELNRSQQLVLDTINDIGNLRLLVYGAITDNQRENLKAAIKTLEDRRAALQAAFEAQRNALPGIGDALGVVADAGGDFAAGIASIESSNWLQAGQKLDSGIKKLGSVLTADRAPPSAPNFNELNDQIRQARADLDAFSASVSQTMEQIVGAQNANLKELIATRDRLEQHRTLARFQFFDLVRASMQEYLQTGDEGLLQSNLDIIRNLFDETQVPSTLSLPSIRDLCRGNPVATPLETATGKMGCIVFARRGQPYSVNSPAGIPLIVLAVGTGTLTRSLEQAFNATEVSILDLSTQYFEDLR